MGTLAPGFTSSQAGRDPYWYFVSAGIGDCNRHWCYHFCHFPKLQDNNQFPIPTTRKLIIHGRLEQQCGAPTVTIGKSNVANCSC